MRAAIPGTKLSQHWSDDERSYLRANYKRLGAIRCAIDLNRTLSAVYEQAFYLGITRIGKVRPTLKGRKPRAAPVILAIVNRRPEQQRAVRIASAPRPSVLESDFIRPPSLARLMAGRA